MDMGITITSRTMTKTASELDAKNLHPDGASSVQNQRSPKGLENENNNERSQDVISKSDITEAADKINTMFQNENRSLQFKVDEDSGRTVINVVDTNTGEQIKQIPSEELLEISRRIVAQLDTDDITGVLVKNSA
jgi:flagellar protein FlaG